MYTHTLYIYVYVPAHTTKFPFLLQSVCVETYLDVNRRMCVCIRIHILCKYVYVLAHTILCKYVYIMQIRLCTSKYILCKYVYALAHTILCKYVYIMQIRSKYILCKYEANIYYANTKQIYIMQIRLCTIAYLKFP